MDDVRGKNLTEYYETRLLVSEQAPYERRLWRFQNDIVAAGGAVVDYLFQPPADFPSFKINWLYFLVGTGGTSHVFVLRKTCQQTGSNFSDLRIARSVGLEAVWTPLVAQDSSFTGDPTASANSVRNVIASSPEFHRGREGQATGDFFRVTSESNATATVTYTITGEIEEIPAASKIGNISNQITESGS